MAVTDKWIEDLGRTLGSQTDEQLNAAYNFTQGGDQAGILGVAGKEFGNKYGPNAQARQMIDAERARRKSIADEQKRQEEARAKALEARRGTAGSLAEDSARRQLAQSMAGIKSDYANRGLLYSGLRGGAEAGAGAEAASNLAEKRASINQATEQELNDIDMGKIQGGLTQFQMEADKNAADYKAALAERQKRAGVGSAVGQGAGALLGAAIPI